MLRTLIEQKLPGSGLKLRIPRAVFVAATNDGTELARPANWEVLLDLVTNIAAATGRVMSLFPSAAPVARITGEVIASVGDFVKYLVEVAVDDRKAPGIAAMEPGGEVVTALNRTQPGQPTANDIDCYAVVSDFQRAHRRRRPARARGVSAPSRDAARRRRGRPADAGRPAGEGGQRPGGRRGVDDPHRQRRRRLREGRVRLRQQSVGLSHQLLPAARDRVAHRAVAAPAGAADAGGHRPAVLAGARRDLLPVGAQASVGAVRALLARAEPPGFVVVAQRDARDGRYGATLHYAITPQEFARATRRAAGSASLADALAGGADGRRPSRVDDLDAGGSLAGRLGAPDAAQPAASRGVLLAADGRPAGVVEAASGPVSTVELARLARRAAGADEAEASGTARKPRSARAAPRSGGGGATAAVAGIETVTRRRPPAAVAPAGELSSRLFTMLGRPFGVSGAGAAAGGIASLLRGRRARRGVDRADRPRPRRSSRPGRVPQPVAAAGEEGTGTGEAHGGEEGRRRRAGRAHRGRAASCRGISAGRPACAGRNAAPGAARHGAPPSA